MSTFTSNIQYFFKDPITKYPSWVIDIIDSCLVIWHTTQVPLKWDTITWKTVP